jgi:acyl carrier protein
MEIEFIKMIAEAIDRDLNTVNLQDEFRDYNEWDSIAFLSIIAALDEHYGVVIDTVVFKEFKTLYDILNYCKNQGI